MFPRPRIARLTTTIGAAAVGLALATAGTAAAASVDDMFLAALQRDGIQVRDPAGAVQLAHGICQQLRQGGSPDAIAQEGANANSNLSVKGARIVVDAAATAYCPQYAR